MTGIRDSVFRRRWTRLAIVLSLAILYVVSFGAISRAVGRVGASLVAIPVAAAGWYFGLEAGLAAGFLGAFLSGILQAEMLGTDPASVMREYWPGYVMVLVIGYLGGVVGRESAEAASARARLRAREQFLVLISTVTRSGLDSGDLGTTYHRLIEYLTHIYAADGAYLTRWDEARHRAVVVAATQWREPLPTSAPIADMDQTELIATVMLSQRVMVIEDVPASPLGTLADGRRPLPRSTRSALCIPLIMNDHGFGGVTLRFDTTRRFSAEELMFAELASLQIAMALWTKEQQLEIRKRLKQADALTKIERALSESERVGIEAILQLIVDSAKDLIHGAERAVLHLIDEDKQVLIPRAVAGIPERATAPLNMRVGEGVAGHVIKTGEVVEVSDTNSDARFLSRTAPSRFRSMVTAPVESNDRRIGTISIMSQRAGAFTEEDGRLLEALGTHAAIAIGNARLLETTRVDLKEINALYRVNRGLAASLDPDQLMKDVVDLLRENFGYYHVQSYMVDPETGDSVARHGSGVIGDLLRERGHRLAAGVGILGHVVASGEAFVTNNVGEVDYFVCNVLLPNTLSELAVPIKVGERVVGALDVQLAHPDRFSARDLQLVTSVANQLAVALQKAELYTELQASLQRAQEMRMQLMHSDRLALVGRLLASVSHELNNPLQAIQNALYLLRDDDGLSPQGQQDLAIVLSETERMASLIGRLRSTYRPIAAEEFQEIQLNHVVEDVHALTATYMRHRKISVEFCPEVELPPILGIPDQIRQVVLNLFMNAIDVMPMNGRLSVQANHLPEAGKVRLAVMDSGPGINPEILPHIFEPFVTDKELGTGLGLTITYDIVSRHQGTIEASNLPEGGAMFQVWFPTKGQQRA